MRVFIKRYIVYEGHLKIEGRCACFVKSPPTQMPRRSKDLASVNEQEDIRFIIDAIHTKSSVGMRFIDAFREKFGVILCDARVRTKKDGVPGEPSNRGTHYDFEILVRFAHGTEEWMQVEHKGSSVKTEIKEDDKPWLAGVQFHNGGSEKYSIAKAYAEAHYNIHIASGALSRSWNLSSPIPTFADWWKGDCCRQGDPTTPFGIELKKSVRNVRGHRGSLLAERVPVVDELSFDSETQAQLIKEVLPIANHALQQKHYWLTVRGILKTGDFNLAWNPQFTIGSIEKVSIRKEKDIFFDFTSAEGLEFSGIMRWGKGAGFSNLRLDLR